MLDQLVSAESRHGLSQGQNTRIKRSRPQEDAILDETRRRLSACGVKELCSLVCEYHEGMLILRGNLSSHYLKQLAQETVRAQPGVNLIVNSTDVAPLTSIEKQDLARLDAVS